ncbi:hypothetical protein [Nocardioides sp. LS1]|uniref:hypothetical protein n=1 Tax=Nocardioides sp. LS1 TaxID=1027620 RepID=UPI000F618365|nr:hypothetical protein [Nocardioides sp. LS1]GCD89231.1 hypothetical protein NLS1_12370 [Nocardioides sp. LS1]
MDRERKPLLRGRGALRAEEFCLHTGLDQAMVDELMRTGHLPGALVDARGSTRVVAIFDDLLPSRDALVALGLPVLDGYDPESLRSVEGEDDPDDE